MCFWSYNYIVYFCQNNTVIKAWLFPPNYWKAVRLAREGGLLTPGGMSPVHYCPYTHRWSQGWILVLCTLTQPCRNLSEPTPRPLAFSSTLHSALITITFVLVCHCTFTSLIFITALVSKIIHLTLSYWHILLTKISKIDQFQKISYVMGMWYWFKNITFLIYSIWWNADFCWRIRYHCGKIKQGLHKNIN